MPAPSPPARSNAGVWIGVAVAIVVGLVAIAALVGSLGDSAKQKLDRVGDSITGPASTAPAEWISFTEPGGAFTVELPGQPQRSDSTQDTEAGPVTVIIFQTVSATKSVGVGMFVAPEGTTFDPEGGARGSADAIHGTLTVTASGTDAAGRPYVDGVIEAPLGNDLIRVIADGTRGFVLQVITTGSADQASFDRLIASFQIVG